jgi:hypothetical protein
MTVYKVMVSYRVSSKYEHNPCGAYLPLGTFLRFLVNSGDQWRLVRLLYITRDVTLPSIVGMLNGLSSKGE